MFRYIKAPARVPHVSCNELVAAVRTSPQRFFRPAIHGSRLGCRRTQRLVRRRAHNLIVLPIALSETEALIDIGDHPPRSSLVLSIFRIACRHQRFLAVDSRYGAGQNQTATKTAAPTPVCSYSRQTEQAHRCVDRMPDVPIWPACHQASFRRVGHHMETAPTERHPRP